MKYQGIMLVSEDLEVVKKFYKEVLGLQVIMDLGENITLTGGISFQTKESWSVFADIPVQDFKFGGLDAELYFEESDLDAFVEKLHSLSYVKLHQGVKEAPWGQRAIRFFDPDMHMIEVGEDLQTVAKRFASIGMDADAVANRMGIPLDMANELLKGTTR